MSHDSLTFFVPFSEGMNVLFALFFFCVLSSLVSHPSTYRVVVGEYNLFEREGSEQYIAVESITIHPRWNGDLGLG